MLNSFIFRGFKLTCIQDAGKFFHKYPLISLLEIVVFHTQFLEIFGASRAGVGKVGGSGPWVCP